ALTSTQIGKQIKNISVLGKPPPRETREILKEVQNNNQKNIKIAIDIVQHDYVEPNCSNNIYPNANNREPLQPVLKKFLYSSDKKVLALLGDSGAGKSTEVSRLANELMISKGKEHIILFIPIKDCVFENLDDGINIIETYLKSVVRLEDKEIKLLKESANNKKNSMIIIFDAYDEKRNAKTFPLFTAEQLCEWGERTKVIVTCRAQYFDTRENCQKLFAPTSATIKTKAYERLQILYLAPFDDNQIKEYINKQHDEECKKSGFNLIAKLNTLSILSNPLVLFLFVQEFIRLNREFKEDKFNARQVFRTDIYNAFISGWVEREQVRLNTINPQLSQDILVFSENLALKMLQNQTLEIECRLDEILCKEVSSIGEEFCKEGTEQKRMASLLMRTYDNRYSILHKSFRDFLAVKGIMKVLVGGTEEECVNIFNQRSLIQEDGFIDFFSEKLIIMRMETKEVGNHYSQIENRLFIIIKKSKTDNNLSTAAANAITLLNAAKVPFSKIDLSGIHIPGANLSSGIFDGTNFENANLSKVNFQFAWLRQTNFKNARMLDVTFGEKTYLQLSGDIFSCVYSQDARYFIAGTTKGLIILYDGETLKEIVKFPCKEDTCSISILSLAFSPSGNLLASGSSDNKIWLWSITDESDKLKYIDKFEQHTDSVNSVAFSPLGNLLASGSNDKTIRLWSITESSELKYIDKFEQHTGSVNSVAFNPLGNLLASGSSDKIIWLWSITKKKYKHEHTFEDHTDSVKSVAFSPLGNLLASGSSDKTIRLWSIAESSELKYIDKFEGHENTVTSIAFRPSGNLLLASGSFRKIRFWYTNNLQHKPTLNIHANPINNASYIRSGNIIVTGSDDKRMGVWSVSESELRLKYILSNDFIPYSLVFNPLGNLLA
ncbi:MAG: pentapeptide repeat-containing protein, partial [Gammaproteobacteria bacterium]